MPASKTTIDETEDSIEQKYIDKLRGGARRIKADIEDLAAALEAGTADEADVYNVIDALSHTYVDVEDAAHTAGAFDAETPAARAANEARKVQFHIAAGNDSAAITAATTAAEYAEQAREDE